MSHSESSDAESLDSDEEIQLAFAEGRLQTGLNLETEEPRKLTNNINGLKQKKADLSNSLPWLERLDLTNDPAPASQGTAEVEGDDDIHNDFRRELKFYRQAQASVLQGIKQLHQLGVPTKRPEDYFAQMAKSDDHMTLVRQKLLEKKMSMERSEKAKKLRDLRKYGKKVQIEVLQKRQKEKREMLDAVKKFRKGHKDQLDFLEEKGNKKKKTEQSDKKFQPNKKRQFKNKKFGFGGQKKRSKMNTADSSADVTDFNPRINSKRKSGRKGAQQGKAKNVRPGKSKRMKIKNRKK